MSADGSAAMFDAIAPTYDRLNRLMSFGSDQRWRRRLARSVGRPASVLDVATGTGDVLRALRREHPGARLVGVDPSAAMLERARAKLKGDPGIELLSGDARALPAAPASFDAVTIAFGLRNVPDRDACLRQMARVVRPGGTVAVLELTEPDGLLGPLARLHVHRVVPWLGGLLSRGEAYRYLSTSIASFPPPLEILERMLRVGLRDVRAEPLCFGAVHLFVGRR
jgi:demethylmenaquinone methyltransferase / 2-methoxy-6-polyprenyl-1,4-benzoquinol methylase